MAYTPGYTYDIFISYAHVDNETISGQAGGWIEQFYKNLNLLLSKRMGRMDMVKFWWDSKKLDGSTVFDKSIEEGIRKSAIMLCLNSPGYLASAYCNKELETFYTKSQQEEGGLHIGDRTRIINILLNNIPFEEWPSALSGATGFAFYNATEKYDFGDPLDLDSPLFRNKMLELRDAIFNILKGFQKTDLSTQKPGEKTPEKKNAFSIYFAEVADTLRTVSKRSIAELENMGFEVISGIPPPFESGLHEKAVKEKIERADLSVHLLDQYPGKEIMGTSGLWYPQKQAEMGIELAKSKLIWVPKELNIEEIEEETYKQFVQTLDKENKVSVKYEYIRGTKSSLTQEIADLAEQIKLQQQQAPVNKNQVSVLLDTHFNDQVYAMELGKTLLENQIQPFINPQEDDPLKNINILGERISQVKKLIFFYGKVSKEWVMERMNAALQLIVSNNYPVEDFYIYLAPPHKNPDEISMKQRFLKINVFDNSDSTQIDSGMIQKILKNLKGEAV